MEQADLFGHELGQGTPGLPRVSVRGAVCTPSPSAAMTSNLFNLSSRSLSPLPLSRKRRKPVSNGTSPSGLPPAPKIRAVNVRSVEPIDLVSVGMEGVDLVLHQGTMAGELGDGVFAEDE